MGFAVPRVVVTNSESPPSSPPSNGNTLENMKVVRKKRGPFVLPRGNRAATVHDYTRRYRYPRNEQGLFQFDEELANGTFPYDMELESNEESVVEDAVFNTTSIPAGDNVMEEDSSSVHDSSVEMGEYGRMYSASRVSSWLNSESMSPREEEPWRRPVECLERDIERERIELAANSAEGMDFSGNPLLNGNSPVSQERKASEPIGIPPRVNYVVNSVPSWYTPPRIINTCTTLTPVQSYASSNSSSMR